MNLRIKQKIEVVLSQVSTSKPITIPSSNSFCKTKEPRFALPDVEEIVNEALRERMYSLKEIAIQHGISAPTVRRQNEGKPGFFRFGRKIMITESRYMAWLRELALDNLRKPPGRADKL